MVIEARRDVSGHLDVLNLITPNRYVMRVKDKNIGSHQDRIGKESHRYGVVRIFSCFFIPLYRRFVGMSAVHQALGCITRQNPGQLCYLRYV